MVYHNEEFRKVFNKLKRYSFDPERYMSEIVDNIIYILINRRATENQHIDEEKVAYFSTYLKSTLKDAYEDYVERSGSASNIGEDIEYIATGFTSIAFRVGDNVIKVGKRKNDIRSIKLDSVHLVPTYIRESHEVGNGFYFSVEVQPYVDTSNITYDDSYEAYCNIRKLGYIWNDPKEENLGRIISVGGCRIGSKRYYSSHEYKQGDLVLIDFEDIAYVGEEVSSIILEEIATMSYNVNVYRFETKYMKEKEQKTFVKVNKEGF